MVLKLTDIELLSEGIFKLTMENGETGRIKLLGEFSDSNNVHEVREFVSGRKDSLELSYKMVDFFSEPYDFSLVIKRKNIFKSDEMTREMKSILTALERYDRQTLRRYKFHDRGYIH